MVVLHYFLGFPPYRSGGLTKYVTDLMGEQINQGLSVIGVWPGEMKIINKKILFKEHKPINGVRSIELINPLPVPLDEGVRNTELFTKKSEIDVFLKFLISQKPDVIHIHTLMGLYGEFVEAANQLGIKTVFTTHDYYGVCSKVTLFHDGVTCDNDNNCSECVLCNGKGLSIGKIFLLQSPLYRILKDSKIVRKLRKTHRSKSKDSSTSQNFTPSDNANDYFKLRKYYVDILESIDIIHYNSSVSKAIYKRYVNEKCSSVITITHKDISNHINERNSCWKGYLRILYLAPTKPYKGYTLLESALDQIFNDHLFDFTLNVYYPVENAPSYVTVNEPYKTKNLANIFENSDVLIAPSIWYETFGFTVLEALSFGVPVIVSDNVGAKDIIGDNGIIVHAGSSSELKEAIITMYNMLSTGKFHVAATSVNIKDIHTHNNEILRLYK